MSFTNSLITCSPFTANTVSLAMQFEFVKAAEKPLDMTWEIAGHDK